MKSAPVSVATVSSRFEADLIVGFLQQYGVRAAVSADDAGGQEPQLQLEGVRVLVARPTRPSHADSSPMCLPASAHDRQTLSSVGSCARHRPTRAEVTRSLDVVVHADGGEQSVRTAFVHADPRLTVRS